VHSFPLLSRIWHSWASALEIRATVHSDSSISVFISISPGEKQMKLIGLRSPKERGIPAFRLILSDKNQFATLGFLAIETRSIAEASLIIKIDDVAISKRPNRCRAESNFCLVVLSVDDELLSNRERRHLRPLR
jgi:hypothetical protein